MAAISVVAEEDDDEDDDEEEDGDMDEEEGMDIAQTVPSISLYPCTVSLCCTSLIHLASFPGPCMQSCKQLDKVDLNIPEILDNVM